jgi:hypothetical protein
MVLQALPRIPLLGLVGLFGLVGCTSHSTDTASSGHALSEAPSASPDVPRFTAAESAAVPANDGRLRISIGGGAVQESETISGRSVCATDPRPYGFDLGDTADGELLILRFGRSGQFPPVVGSYACSSGDAMIAAVAWDAQGHASTDKQASSCSVVVDEIDPAPSPAVESKRVFGRFEAAAATPNGLPVAFADPSSSIWQADLQAKGLVRDEASQTGGEETAPSGCPPADDSS